MADINPYAPPEVIRDSRDPATRRGRRYAFLLLPPFIPPIVHAFVRFFIPADETLYHALFTLGTTIPALIWTQSMVDRLRLSIWMSYLIAFCVWAAVWTTALLSPTLVTWVAG